MRAFEGVRAVDDVSMSFERGRLTGIIGPNGAGKSTAPGHARRHARAHRGKIYYRGEDVTSLPAYRRAQRGLVRTFQLASEFKRLTVLENLLTAVPGQKGETFRARCSASATGALRSATRSSARRRRSSASASCPWPIDTPVTSAAVSGGSWKSCAR